MPLRWCSLVTAAVALTLGACANQASAPDRSQTPLGASRQFLHCDSLRIVQNGREIVPVDGELVVARAPFLLVYTGRSDTPAVALSTTPTLSLALDKLDRPLLWGAVGDYMAHDPVDLPTREGARLLRTDLERDRFAAGIGGLSYVKLLQAQMAANPKLDTAIAIPRAGGGFAPQGQRQVQEVQKIGDTPVASVQRPEFYIAYFATEERLGPTPSGYKSLLKMSWGTCRLRFS